MQNTPAITSQELVEFFKKDLTKLDLGHLPTDIRHGEQFIQFIFNNESSGKETVSELFDVHNIRAQNPDGSERKINVNSYVEKQFQNQPDEFEKYKGKFFCRIPTEIFVQKFGHLANENKTNNSSNSSAGATSIGQNNSNNQISSTSQITAVLLNSIPTTSATSFAAPSAPPVEKVSQEISPLISTVPYPTHEERVKRNDNLHKGNVQGLIMGKDEGEEEENNNEESKCLVM